MGIIIGFCIGFIVLIIFLSRSIITDLMKTNDNLYNELAKLEEQLKDYDLRIKANTARCAQLEKDVQSIRDNKPHMSFNDEEFDV